MKIETAEKKTEKVSSLEMVTGIKLISQQQVTINTMGLNGITASQNPTQETPVKRSTASDTRRVSFNMQGHRLYTKKMNKKIGNRRIFMQQ